MVVIDDLDVKVLINSAEIQKKVEEIADILNKEYCNEEVYLICVLKGSIMFTVDLMKHLNIYTKLECIRLASYGSNRVSSGKVSAVDISLPDLSDKNVVIVEDIVDTGRTAQFLLNFIHANYKTKSTKFVTLLDKKSRREVDIDPDVIGFSIDDKFVLGYGLDYEGGYRNLPYIGYVEN